MRISDMHWQQVEAYLRHDDRAVLPLGSTEQHAFLSLSTDSVLAERVAAEAGEPLGVPVFPVAAYGITPSSRAYPGTWKRLSAKRRAQSESSDNVLRFWDVAIAETRAIIEGPWA